MAKDRLYVAPRLIAQRARYQGLIGQTEAVGAARKLHDAVRRAADAARRMELSPGSGSTGTDSNGLIEVKQLLESAFRDLDLPADAAPPRLIKPVQYGAGKRNK